jgi:hypothetical protein
VSTKIIVRTLLVLVLNLLHGCAVVHLTNSKETISTTIAIGIVDISLDHESYSYSIDSTGIGIVKTGSDLTIGYNKTELVGINSDCQIVFIIENTPQAEQATNLIKNIDNSCLVELNQLTQ